MIVSAHSPASQSRVSLGWRVLCFLLCVPSGGALLAKVYGVLDMQNGTLLVALPCCLALIGIWLWAKRTGRNSLAEALAIGCLGGLLGTLAYDVVRIPPLLAGQRIFAPISSYGVWIADAGSSSRWTELLGWSYHFSNGLTFGIMYTLWLRKRHWAWAILWGLVLETIALVSPFGRIFYLVGNYQAIGIAYFGHIAYGLPLGWLAYRWEETDAWLSQLPTRRMMQFLLIVCAAIAWLIFWPTHVQQDARVTAGEFRIEGNRLNPDWLRLPRNGSIQVFNPEAQEVTVVVRQTNARHRLASQAKEMISFPQPGIYQLFVETSRQTRSSFVIVEPVEEFR